MYELGKCCKLDPATKKIEKWSVEPREHLACVSQESNAHNTSHGVCRTTEIILWLHTLCVAC